MDAQKIAETLGGAHRSGANWSCRCPCHEDSRASLSITDSPTAGLLVKCFAGCDSLQIIATLRDRGLWPEDRSLTPIHPMRSETSQKAPSARRIVAVYPYADEAGQVLYEAIRYEPKDFRLRRPEPSEPSGYCWRLRGGDRRVPYRLPEILASRVERTVFVTEGEKDADNLAALDLIATTAAGGAHWQWPKEFAEPFRGRHVCILPDNDEPGEQFATMVHERVSPVARSVLVLRLPGLGAKQDVSDWLRHGGTREALGKLLSDARANPAGDYGPRPKTPHKPAQAAQQGNGHDREPTDWRDAPASNVIDLNAARKSAPGPVLDIAPSYSDDQLALDFTAKHGDRLRYVATWGQWYAWDGSTWNRDDTLDAFNRARELGREKALAVIDDPDVPPGQKRRTAMNCTHARTVASIERLARADRTHAATTDQWDADPWLLNTPGGIVDLRTGQLRPARMDDYCTRSTPCTPKAALCPTWTTFLERVTGGDKSLQCFMQRMAGYALTGVTREHALFFVYGTGGNGKSTFTGVLQHLMGSYAETAPMDTFTESKNERHSTELARLRGARLVVATETEEGRKWAEAKIKALTGGDPITARFMRQDNFTFIPQFKLVISGNHKPGLRNVDEAMRRRLHLIPFTVTIPDSEKDQLLMEKLREEAPAILQWCIEGCVSWLANSLAPPASVRNATAEYLEGEDRIGQWIEECTERDLMNTCKVTALYRSYSAWCEASSEYALPRGRFMQALEAKGYPKRMSGNNPLVVGLRLPVSSPNF